ncbi:MAG: hypothetical protein WC554_11460 [Clostridia bacterium]
MKQYLNVIKEAIEIIEKNLSDKKCIIDQCRLIIKYAKEIKKEC